MASYLVVNKSTFLSKFTFSLRAGTYDLKAWNEWKYTDRMCVMSNMLKENMDSILNGFGTAFMDKMIKHYLN